ncbi:MAG: TVP38/TMEM64 family protein [Gemmatimonadales bacterium]|nr:TVP38/TMEM64 family protein [Gemmatimonadales bacterium]
MTNPDTTPVVPVAGPAWGRWLLLAAAAGGLALLGREAAPLVPRFAGRVAALGAAGALLFVLGYAAAVVALVPGSVLTLAAGAVFGLGAGIALVFTGAVLGAAAAFLVARHLARGLVERRLGSQPRFAAIDRAVGRDGRRIVFLLRLSPLVPFSLLNYALGLTRVSFGDYLLASVGMLPGTVLYVYYGKLAGDVASLASGAAPPRDAAYWLVLGVGLAATVAVTTLVTRAARRALAEATDAA